MQRRLIWWALAAAGGLVLLIGFVELADVRPALGAPVVSAARGEVKNVSVARATVKPISGTTRLRARVAGRVKSVLVREGEQVTRGQLLVEMELDEFEGDLARANAARSSQIDIAKSGIADAQQAYAAALREVRRARALHGTGSESSAVLERSETNVATARGRVSESRARLELAGGGALGARGDARVEAARKRLEWTRIVAPIDGVILSTDASEGDVVGELGPLVELVDPSRTEFELEVDERDSSRLAPGLLVDFAKRGSVDVLVHGKIARVGSAMHRPRIGVDDARTRAEALVRSAWVRSDEAEGPPVPIGQTLEARVVLPSQGAPVRVPREAISVEDGAARVHVVWGPLALRRRVDLGRADEHFVELLGIEPGERLLANR